MVVLDSGDIAYFPLGVFPVRKHNVVQGVYTKLGDRVENQWQGLITSADMPYVVNPDKGYLVSCNNFVASARMKYGVSHAFSLNHRKVRISELIEDLIDAGKQINVKDLQTIQNDILDVQMRHSIPDMVAAVHKGARKLGLTNPVAMRALVGVKILEGWDFKFDKDKPQGAVVEAWEFMLATYMHETKISDVRLRRGIQSLPESENFLYKQVAKWAAEEETREEYCKVHELKATNTCQELMAFTLAKAIMDLEERLGPYDGTNWRMGDLVKVRYEHNPFSETILRSKFEQIREESGNRRTPSMHMHFYHTEGARYQVQGGPVFKQVHDFSEPTSSFFAMDVELDQSHLWSTQTFEPGLTQLWEKSRYFRMPTFELAGQIRFKLKETAKTVMLYPGEI